MRESTDLEEFSAASDSARLAALELLSVSSKPARRKESFDNERKP